MRSSAAAEREAGPYDNHLRKPYPRHQMRGSTISIPTDLSAPGTSLRITTAPATTTLVFAVNLTRMCQVDRKYGGRRSRCDTDLQTCTGCAPHRQNRDSLPPHVGTAGLLSRRSKKGWSCWPRAFRFAARYMGSQRCICGKRTPSGVRFWGKGGQAPLFI